MVAVKRIRVELELEDGRFVSRVTRATAAVGEMDRATHRAGASVARAEGHVQTFGKSLRDSVVVIGLARSALSNLHMVSTNLVVGLVKTNAQFERMQTLLEGLSDASGRAAKKVQAESDFNYLVEQAKNAPFALTAITDSFVKMRSVGIDPTKGAMDGLLNAVANFGGNSEILKRASVAIQQMAGKGVISMEELRQQLGEAVPSAIRLLARSVGMTYQELVDKISRGQVEASSALANLFSEFNKTFGGSAQNLMSTMTGMISRLATEWQLFQKEIGDTKIGDDKTLFGLLKEQMRDLIFLFQDPEFKQFGADLARGIAAAISGLRSLIGVLATYRHEIVTVGAIMASVWAAQKVTSFFTHFIGSLNMTMPALAMFRTSLIANGTVMETFVLKMLYGNTIMQLLGNTTIFMAGALRALGFAFNMLLGPVGLVIAAIYALATAFDWFGTRSQDALQKVRDGMAETLTAAEVEKFKKRLKEIQDKIAEHEAFIQKNTGPGFKGQRDQRAAEIKRLQTEQSEIQMGLAVKTQTSITNEVRRGTEQRLAVIGDETTKIRDEWVKRANDLEDQLKATEGNEAERAKVIEQQRANGAKFHAETIAALSAAIQAEEAKMESAGETAVQVSKEVIRRLQELKRAAQENEKSDPYGKHSILAPKDDGDQKLNQYEQMVKRFTTGIAKAKAKVDELSPSVAEVQSLLDNGFLKNRTPEEVKNLLALAAGFDKATAEAREHAQAVRESASAMEQLDKMLGDSKAKLDESLGELMNPNDPKESTALQNFRARTKEQVDKTLESTGERIRAEQNAADAISNFQRTEIINSANGLREKTANIKASLMERKESIAEELRLEEERIRKSIDLSKLQGEEKVKAEALMNDHIDALRDKATRDSEGAMESMLRKWKNVTEQMDEAGARWMSNFVDTTIDALAEGEARWDQFAIAVLKNILRIQMQQQMAGVMSPIIQGMGTWFGSLFGPAPVGVGAAGAGAMNPKIGMDTPIQMHSGGIVGSEIGDGFRNVASSLFASAQRFHGGGMIGANEVPIIAEKGEGVFTAAQMRAMGRGGSNMPPQVTINIRNQSGQQVAAKQGDVKFDAEGMILDLIITKANQPGKFREGLREAVR
jgi:tape measure domain-containing protein